MSYFFTTTAKASNPDAIEMEITTRMKVGHWKEVAAYLRSAAFNPTHAFGKEIEAAIAEMTSRYEKTIEGSG